MKTISGKVVSYSDIPSNLSKDQWFEEFTTGCYVECHIDLSDGQENANELDNWLMNNYPDIEEETFYIEMDY